MKDIKFRILSEFDIEEYWNFIYKAPLEITSLEKYKSEIAERLNSEITILCINHKIIACCKIKFVEDFIYFGGMYINPAYRGQGLCHKLNEERMRILKERIDLIPKRGYTKIISEILGTGDSESVHPNSIGAYKSLIKLGFTKIGYSNDKDKGIILERTLV